MITHALSDYSLSTTSRTGVARFFFCFFLTLSFQLYFNFILFLFYFNLYSIYMATFGSYIELYVTINGRIEIEPGHAQILIVTAWPFLLDTCCDIRNVRHYTYNYRSIGDLFGSTSILSYYSIQPHQYRTEYTYLGMLAQRSFDLSRGVSYPREIQSPKVLP